MTTIFPGGLNQCYPPIATTEAGGSLAGGIIYLGIQALNEAGVNFCSTLVQVSYTAGSRIRVAFNPANRTAGTLFPYYLLIASLTNDPAQGHVVGLWRNWETDGKTLAVMADILLSETAQLVVPPTAVDNPTLLPETALEGQVRQVTNLGAYYLRFDTTEAVDNLNVIADTGGGKWVLHPGSTNYGAFPIGGTSGIFGCHQPAANLNAETLAANRLFPRPSYTPDGSASLFDPNQPPIRLGFQNIYESEMAVGRRLRLNAFLNGSEPVSNLLSGKLFAKVVGFVNPATGELTTDNGTGDGNEMEGVGEWIPVDAKVGFFILQRPLPLNWIVAVEIAIGFKASELQIAPGSVLSFTLSCGVQSGVIVEGGYIYRQPQGGLLYKGDYTARVVPSIAGVKVERSNGGLIHGTQKRVYEFLDTPDQFLSGFVPNTANQKITLSRDGVAINRGVDAVQSSEALLAIVSTISGETPVFWGSSTALSNQGISLTLTYPTTIRSDHENAGKTTQFNASFLRFYLRINGTIYRQDSTIAVATGLVTQSFTLASLDGFTQINSVPVETILGLFGSPSQAVTVISGGLTGGVEVGVSYVYSGATVSDISQRPDQGCIKPLDFESQLEAIAKKWAIILG